MRNIFTRDFILMTAALLLSLQLMAQQQTVTGSVVDAKDNSAMIGVTVMEKGTSNGTVTDLNGKFSLRLSTQNPVLVFSSVGYKTMEIPVENRSTLNIKMEEDVEILQEVVVIGYGTMKKSDLTGSVATLIE